MKTVAIANQKGGVGKTTISRNATFYGQDQGLRVLALDLDQQHNFSNTMVTLWRQYAGVADNVMPPPSLTAKQLFDKPSNKTRKLKPLDCGGGISLIKAERDLLDVAGYSMEALMRPAEALKQFADDYDVCIIDTAPTLGKPLYAALIAADYVVCPCTMDQDATDGLGDLLEDINRVIQYGWNSDLELLGVLANKVNNRRVFDRDALAQVQGALGDLVMTQVLYDRAATQYAKDRPVWRAQSGDSQIKAAKEMKAVCGQIYSKLTA